MSFGQFLFQGDLAFVRRESRWRGLPKSTVSDFPFAMGDLEEFLVRQEEPVVVIRPNLHLLPVLSSSGAWNSGWGAGVD
jgi:hypothetical protein